MLTLTIRVPAARERTAYATLREATRTLASGPAVASASTAYASRHANPTCDPLKPGGHAPFGRYRLLHHERTDARQGTHYGAHLLLFEPRSGAALEAESFGRLGLLVFGGASRRRTQGGVRVANDLLEAIVTRVEKGESVTLAIEPAGTRRWWQFWKPAQPPSEPVTGSIELPQPPDDELTLIEALLRKAPRAAASDAGDTHDPDFRRDEDRGWSSTERESGERFHGKGGETGGGGASGKWDAPDRPGVDSAGRIVGAAAAVGAVAAAAAPAASRDGTEGGTGDAAGSGPAADTGTSTSY